MITTVYLGTDWPTHLSECQHWVLTWLLLSTGSVFHCTIWRNRLHYLFVPRRYAWSATNNTRLTLLFRGYSIQPDKCCTKMRYIQNHCTRMIEIEHVTLFSSMSGWHPGNSLRRSSMCTTGNQFLNKLGSPVYGMGLPRMMLSDSGPTVQSSYSVSSQYWLSSSSFPGLSTSLKFPEIVTVSSG